MKIAFACPYCGKKLSASATSAGKEKTCPNCRGARGRADGRSGRQEGGRRRGEAARSRPTIRCCSWDAGPSMKT